MDIMDITDRNLRPSEICRYIAAQQPASEQERLLLSALIARPATERETLEASWALLHDLRMKAYARAAGHTARIYRL